MTFDLILADPPWRYDFSRSRSRAIEPKYDTLSSNDLQCLSVRSLAKPDATLMLWATAPKLPEALAVMEAWGFRYTTSAVWDKQRIGMGYYFRGQHELLLVGKRGSPRPPAPATRPPSVIRERRGAHSAKPGLVYALLERMYPDARRLELFARAERPGWTAIGAEIDGRDIREALRRLASK